MSISLRRFVDRRTRRKAAKVTHPSILIHLAPIHLPIRAGEILSPLRMKSSSKTKGKETTILNGHPIMAPIAKQIVANKTRSSAFFVDGRSAKDIANILKYMANVEGRNAESNSSLTVLFKRHQQDVPVEAFHIPALKKSIKNM